jgi:hypothetical protein
MRRAPAWWRTGKRFVKDGRVEAGNVEGPSVLGLRLASKPSEVWTLGCYFFYSDASFGCPLRSYLLLEFFHVVPLSDLGYICGGDIFLRIDKGV